MQQDFFFKLQLLTTLAKGQLLLHNKLKRLIDYYEIQITMSEQRITAGSSLSSPTQNK